MNQDCITARIDAYLHTRFVVEYIEKLVTHLDRVKTVRLSDDSIVTVTFDENWQVISVDNVTE